MTVRMPSQFKSLDPGYMFGSTEMAVQFGCLPILANYNPGGERSWQPSYYVTSIECADDLNIRFSVSAWPESEARSKDGQDHRIRIGDR